jgi:hypothetical protein
MMPPANTDANYRDEINHLVGASSAAESEKEVENLNLNAEQGTVSDMDRDISKPDDTSKLAAPSAPDDKGTDKVEATKTPDITPDPGKDEKGKDDKPLPFHEHPDWKRMITERNEAREVNKRLEAQVEILTKTYGPPKQEDKPVEADTGEKLPFKDITQIPDDELVEWMQDKPKEYAANLYAQVRHEIIQELKARGEEVKAKADVESELTQFAQSHPDFTNLWGSDGGEILQYMKDHPGRDAQYAYYTLTESKHADEIKQAAEQAKEAGRKEAEANYQAKRNASNVLGSGSPMTGVDTDDILKDTSKHGGPIAALTRKLLAGRRAAL